MKKPRINEFRHFITFQSKALGGVDDYGQRVPTWTTSKTAWAKLEAKSSKETASSDRRVQSTEYVFTIRKVDGLNALMRISYGGNYYSIQGVYDEEGLGKHLVIKAMLDDGNDGTGVV